ncbi:hypothetical protein Tco_0284345, partial [Tanacetum coccineum]
MEAHMKSIHHSRISLETHRQNIPYRSTKPKVLSVKQWKPTDRKILLGEQCPLVKLTALNNTAMLADTQANNIPVEYHPVVQFIGTVRFENDHFGAIMGYGDY